MKVKYLGKGGFDYERQEANRILTPGEAYEVKSLHVGTFQSRIKLVGVKGEFNSVMFEKLNGGSIVDGLPCTY